MSTKSCLRLSRCFVRQCAYLNPNSLKLSRTPSTNSLTRIIRSQSGAAHPARISSGRLILSTRFMPSGNTGMATPKRKFTNRTRSRKYFAPIFLPTTNFRAPNRHTSLHLSRWRCLTNTKTLKATQSSHIEHTICHRKNGASLHGLKGAALPLGGFPSQTPSPTPTPTLLQPPLYRRTFAIFATTCNKQWT